MTKNAVNKTWNFTGTGDGGTYNSWQPEGVYSYSATLGGYGTAPALIMFDRFKGQSDGETVNQQADHGLWRANGNFSYNNRPPVISYKGRKGVAHNSLTAGQGTTKFGLGVESLNFTSFIEFCKLSNPSDLGRTFAGSSVLESFPPVSSLKVTWPAGHGWNGSAGENDLINYSHAGYGNMRSNGNNMLGHYLGGFSGHWEWSKWNSMLRIYQPEIGNIQGANGRSDFYMWNDNGRLSDINYPFACWQQNPDVTPAMQTPLGFDRIAVLAWSGNGVHTDSQLYLTQYVLYGGDDRGAYILLANNADLSLATNVDGIGYESWDDTQVDFKISGEEKAANTHWFVYSNLTLIDSGAL